MRMRTALLTLLAGTALAVPAGPASAAACSNTTAVTVVVDFASLGGGTQTRCTGVDPPSGLVALRDAGFTPTRAAQQPGYFVCRIDGKPASDPCQRTSPASAYWSYWHAKRGGSWTYSSAGAADYDPPAGTVEGWAFGAGKPPSSAPPPAAAPAPSPSPSPTRSRPATPLSAPASPPPAAASPTSAASAAAAPVSAAPNPSPAASRSPSPDASASASDAPLVTSFGGPADPPQSSSRGPLLAAGLVALLLAGAAVAVVRRRRDGDL